MRRLTTQRSSRRRSNLRCLPFGRLWYDGPNAVSNAIGYAKHRSRSDNAVIRVYDEAGNVIETHEHTGDFKMGERGGLLSCRLLTHYSLYGARNRLQDAT